MNMFYRMKSGAGDEGSLWLGGTQKSQLKDEYIPPEVIYSN